MSTSHLAAFIAGSSLVTILAISVFVRVSGIRIAVARDDSFRLVQALQTVVVAALLVVFVTGAFAAAR